MAGQSQRITGKWEIDTLRDEFESDREWKLRRMFLLANAGGTLPHDRLVCLSKCFINMAMSGCSYPQPVMTEIKSRSGGMLEEYQRDVKVEKVASAKRVYAGSFVKASDTEGWNTSNTTNTKSRSDYDNRQDQCGRESQFTGQNSVHSPDGDGYHGQRFRDEGRAEDCNQPDKEEEKDDEAEEAYEVWNYNDDVVVSQDASQDGRSYDTAQINSQSVRKRDIRGIPNRGENQALPRNDNGLVEDVLEENIPQAKPVLTLQEYHKLWSEETNIVLKKLRLLAYRTFVSQEPTAYAKVTKSKDDLCPLKTCHRWDRPLTYETGIPCAARVYFDDVFMAVGVAKTRAKAKYNGYEAALRKVYMPYLSMYVDKEGEKHIQASSRPFHDGGDSVRYTGAQNNNAVAGCSSEPPTKLSRTNMPARASATVVNEETSSAPSYPFTKIESNLECIQKKRVARGTDLSHFIIVESPSGVCEGSEGNVLQRAANFTGMLLEHVITVNAPANISCIVKIEGTVVGTGAGTCKKSAKLSAAVSSLKYLRALCWVLKLKDGDSSNSFSKDELFKDLQTKQESTAISDNNIGSMLLRKMGWSGGGVGKHGDGIAEPVRANGVLGRAGLGLDIASCSKEFNPGRFRQLINKALRDYISSGEQDDLRFSPEFGKEERAIIHQVAQKLGLKKGSRGSGDNRYITIGHKQSGQQVLRHVSEMGGETKHYVLLPPGSSC